MSFPKVFLFSTLALFGLIMVVGVVKKGKARVAPIPVNSTQVQEIEFAQSDAKIIAQAPVEVKKEVVKSKKEKVAAQNTIARSTEKVLPSANYIDSFFDPAAIKLPIVETVTYARKVPWLKGKFAWISDYASHYRTSKHFIARSLNKKADYFTQEVKNGDCFNVLRTDKNFYFYLLVDINRCKMLFYYVDQDLNQRTLVKTYDVGVGRFDEKKASGSLTPIGKFSLGDKIAVYRPGVMGYFNNQQIEMIKVFGSRWIPFESEIENCSAPAKGFGIHGAPWVYNQAAGKWEEDLSGISKFDSDGCLRLPQKDMEELFAIIVSRPTVIELVKDYYDAKLPGEEKKFD